MKTAIRTTTCALALLAALHMAPAPTQAAITSDFNDLVYPGAAGDGWVGGWTNTTVGSPAIAPEILTASPIDAGSPYLHFDATGGNFRNVMRRYESGGGVNPAASHTIRWKFRLTEADFDSAFAVFNDRVHFFARTAPRLGGSTDVSISWSIMAAGAAHTSGAVANKTFWVFDNVDGTGGFTLGNHVDSGIPLVPNHVYAFAVTLSPDQQTYTVSIVDETGSVSFASAAPHRFRNLTASGDSHVYLHFGAQADPASDSRPFDLDSVSLESTGAPALENVVPEAYAIQDPTKGIQFNVVAQNPVPAANIGLVLNGINVSAQLVMTGTDTSRNVSYTGLAADTVYEMTITATNASGTAALTRTFYTATKAFTLYDSEGFTSDTLYPPGPLQPVVHGNATWVPSTEPSDVVDLFDGQYGKVLQRMNMGDSRNDVLQLPPVSSGVITIEFDTWVSITSGRTIDISLATSTGTWASHVAWGAVSDKLSYYSTAAANWVPVVDLPAGWHHCKIIHYLSGAAAGRYDILLNGSPVAEKILWRNAIPGTPLSVINYQSHSSGPAMQYGQIDNFKITAAPEDPNAFPPPAIVNLSPAAYAVVRPTQNLSFEVTSGLPMAKTDIGVVLNGSNVTSGLTVTGTPDHWLVSYGPLNVGAHSVEINATNGAGPVNATVSFYATVDPLTLFDSGGFEDNSLYPVGYLTAVTNAGSRWVPALEPNSAEIVDLVDGQHGKVLRRQQLGADYADYLIFPPVSSGVVEIELDARMSALAGRVLDLSLNSVTANGGGTQGPFIMWSTDALQYYNGTAWVSVLPMDTSWHRVKLTCYVSGTKAGRFDLSVDNAIVGDSLVWRNVFSPVGTLRLAAFRGSVMDYGDMDHLVIRAAPEAAAALPVTLLQPAHSGTAFTFAFQSVAGTNYRPQYNTALSATGWMDLSVVTGDGTEKTVTHDNPPAGPLFYRVLSEMP